ncbi:alpha/beta hydrolase [Halovulum sp. GXIMD14793]
MTGSAPELTVLALHGSGQDETSLAGFARQIAPDANLLSPRGLFSDGRGYTFFRRGADRSIDTVQVLRIARDWLNRDIELPAAGRTGALLVGYSSGAVFAEALLAEAPTQFSGAILLRPEPLAADFCFPQMDNKPVLILAGQKDERRKPEHGRRLAEQFRSAGACVTYHMLDCGHGWASEDQDLCLAQSWLKRSYNGARNI